MKSTRQALKRERLFNGLAARVNSCPSLFTAKAGFFRNLWLPGHHISMRD
jgi:hypothetical protein